MEPIEVNCVTNPTNTAPERVWYGLPMPTIYTAENQIPSHQAATEYIRADLHTAALERVTELEDEVIRLQRGAFNCIGNCWEPEPEA